MIYNSEIFKIIKYGIVGVMGTAIHYMTLVLLVEIYAFDSKVASAIGFIITVAASYVLNRFWTFKSGRDARQFFKYAIVSTNGFILNLLIMFLGVDVIKLNYKIAQLFVIGVLPFVNYVFNRLWVFRKVAAE